MSLTLHGPIIKYSYYHVLADRLKSVSEWLGVAMNELSPVSKGHVQNLAAASLALGLGECSDTRYSND